MTLTKWAMPPCWRRSYQMESPDHCLATIGKDWPECCHLVVTVALWMLTFLAGTSFWPWASHDQTNKCAVMHMMQLNSYELTCDTIEDISRPIRSDDSCQDVVKAIKSLSSNQSVSEGSVSLVHKHLQYMITWCTRRGISQVISVGCYKKNSK